MGELFRTAEYPLFVIEPYRFEIKLQAVSGMQRLPQGTVGLYTIFRFYGVNLQSETFANPTRAV